MSDDPVTVLSDDENWELLSSMAPGRLITNFAGEPEVFPVNYVVQDHTVLFRTAPGTKLVSAVANRAVVFEVDDHNVAEGWSVIVRGNARLLQTDADIRLAERAQLLPWTATLKPHYVRITPTEVTRRSFRFGPEPHRA